MKHCLKSKNTCSKKLLRDQCIKESIEIVFPIDISALNLLKGSEYQKIEKSFCLVNKNFLRLFYLRLCLFELSLVLYLACKTFLIHRSRKQII